MGGRQQATLTSMQFSRPVHLLQHAAHNGALTLIEEASRVTNRKVASVAPKVVAGSMDMRNS